MQAPLAGHGRQATADIAQGVAQKSALRVSIAASCYINQITKYFQQ
ncbi:hypothetical protein [Chitinolyticbacter meiyuanensis]|nr:hypothetical protein [Chitinolyticbacter meiyuanensis]